MLPALPATVPSFSAVFRFMDINGDNVLEFSEIKEMFKVLGVAMSARELDMMIKQVPAST